ncbi:F-box/kelch-repeat protein SKIP11-like [Coffea eugenioides]|uniref:F-box/kelch-repeat protein SKIP11-like n=1 Tax=Coffea arabica TaxID=13443 RepID=A0A6P6XAJ1_COFAR|nr:F-box/kelch-repeat protein SKIP11-like [Coffea eugenioides]
MKSSKRLAFRGQGSKQKCPKGGNSKRKHLEEETGVMKPSKPLAFQGQAMDQEDDQVHYGYYIDTSSLVLQLGQDLSINCLLRCSRADYGTIASLNQSFRSLIRRGDLYKLRRQLGIVEHWVYVSCSLLEWEAFDPLRRRWMSLPKMISNECFLFSDKESLAVGTELLVFGKEIESQVIYKYSILTNAWSFGVRTNIPRWLFGSASLGEIAIVACGCDSKGNLLSSAELYNSMTESWCTLPRMHKPRKLCSGVFIDSKFYVIGGVGIGNPSASDGASLKVLTCGEVYDLRTGTWFEIPDMYPQCAREGTYDSPATTRAPALLAVVKNELYAAYCDEKEVWKYDKQRNMWITIGRLPEQATSMNGWGLAFRACGNQLMVIGGLRALNGGCIDINAWEPDEGPLEWTFLGTKHSGSFVYNCAVMRC